MGFHLKILSWALISLLQLRFPPRKSVAYAHESGEWTIESEICRLGQMNQFFKLDERKKARKGRKASFEN